MCFFNKFLSQFLGFDGFFRAFRQMFPVKMPCCIWFVCQTYQNRIGISSDITSGPIHIYYKFILHCKAGSMLRSCRTWNIQRCEKTLCDAIKPDGIFCRNCRISRWKLCRVANKIRQNVLILRKTLSFRLQNGYKLVYFITVNAKKLWRPKGVPAREYRCTVTFP